MRILTASFLLLALPGGVTLSTQYKADRALRMEINTSLKMETTTMEMERDGQPVEGMGGGMSSETTHKEVHVDKVVEAKDGKPTKVHRSFEKVGGKSSRSMGENSNDTDIESPLDGVTLEIKRGEGDKIEVTTVDGKAPDAKVLEGHLPEIFLDGLLPEGEMKADATWDVESDAIKRALRLDVTKALYPRPEREDAAGGQGGGGGGRRRGGRMGGGPDVMQLAEWKGKAKLISTDKDVDGKTCAVIELKLTASGDLPEPEMGGGRRGDRSFEPDFAAIPDSILGAKNAYEISLEGKFVFAIKEKRPVSLELEGTSKMEMQRESKRDDHTMKFHSVLEGTVSYKVAVSEEAAKSEK
jgi:hypothetical protein